MIAVALRELRGLLAALVKGPRIGRTRLACCVAAASLACTLGFGAPAALAWEYVTGPPQVSPQPWQPMALPRGKAPIEGRHAFTLSVSSGYCSGEPPTRIDHVKVVERPKTAARPFKSAVITAFVLRPAPTEVVGSINPGEPSPGCADIGERLTRRIKLKRPVESLFLYDGSYCPPRRAWPEPSTRSGLSQGGARCKRGCREGSVCHKGKVQRSASAPTLHLPPVRGRGWLELAAPTSFAGKVEHGLNPTWRSGRNSSVCRIRKPSGYDDATRSSSPKSAK